MNDSTAVAALAVLTAGNNHRAGQQEGGALVDYLAQDMQGIRADLRLSRAVDWKRDREIEDRLDRAERAVLLLTAELSRQTEQAGQLWTAIRELARRIETKGGER